MRAARRHWRRRAWAAGRQFATLNFERIGHLPCNCSIGGPAKGHLAREVDALGGEMGRNTDKTLTHIRYVGTGKGPAVQTLRAHADKELYPQEMRRVLETTPNLTMLQVAVEDLLTKDEGGRMKDEDNINTSLIPHPSAFVAGVRLADGTEITAKTVVVTTGTFLNGLMHCGETQTAGGRRGGSAQRRIVGGVAAVGVPVGAVQDGNDAAHQSAHG